MDEDLQAQGHLQHEAILGALARPLVHEFNNFLNGLLLRIAVLKLQSAEILSSEFTALDIEARAVASLLREWQNIPKMPRPEGLARIDLNRVADEVIRDLGRQRPNDVKISLELTEGPLWVCAEAWDMRLLCTLMLRIGAYGRTEGADRAVRVRTEKIQPHAILLVQTKGETMSAEAVAEMCGQAGNSRSRLELAACQGIARRLNGRLEIHPCPDEGVAISCTLLVV